MQFSAVLTLVQNEFEKMNRLMAEELHSEVTLITQIGHYLIEQGGKRIRPLLLLLAAKALGANDETPIIFAAAIEFIHTATLLHDDVVDDSKLRRGRDSANVVFGNAATVLSGDFLYSRAFQLLVRTQHLKAMSILASATNKIAEGEVQQLTHCHNPDLSEAEYFEVIYSKTAKLFEAAAELAGVLQDSPNEIQTRLREYGRHLGTAFQIVDDVLDYMGNSQEIGKQIGDDLREGKTTLPLIFAMQKVSQSESIVIRQAIQTGSTAQLNAICQSVQNSGALEYCYQKAHEEAQKAALAIQILPESPYKEALLALTRICVERRS
ncbi:MAG: octaprenyl diphosphate synthase [Gammaproteobacteria bacterium]|nr:octaprenyl diphosphate synthase [Gammaproteobacteria bacterium]